METVNQPTQTESMNVTPTLDSSTSDDSPQSIKNVETEDSSNSTKQSLNESDHTQNKTTTEQKAIETTNIQLPLVDKVDNDNDEEPMDISCTVDDIDEYNKIHNNAQQVEEHVERHSQSQPQLYNVEFKKRNNTSDDDKGETTLLIESKKCKYEETKKIEEDELLKSDNEDDNFEGRCKEKALTDLDTISMEKEEELLKSEDEEEEAANSRKEEGINAILKEVDSEERESPAHEHETRHSFQNSNKDVKQMGESDNFKIHNKFKVEELFNQNSLSESHGSKENTHLQAKKFRKNAENHRILYQFDLDDDSSSQDSYQHKISSPIQTIENMKETTLSDSQSFSETADIIDIKKESREELDQEDGGYKAENKNEIPYSSPESDGAVSDDETGIPCSYSPPVTNAKDDEDYSDNEGEKQYHDSPSQYPQQVYLKSKIISDENYILEQNVNDVEETTQCSRKLSDSTTDNLQITNNNDNCDEIYQNKTLTDDSTSNNNEMHLNYKNSNDLNVKENTLLSLIENGDGGTEIDHNSIEQFENSNDIYFKTGEKTKVLKATETSNSLSSSQHEESRTSNNDNLNDNDSKIEIGTDNECSLKINDNIQEYQHDETNDNEAVRKQILLSPPPLAISHEEDEASRSSLASSASYCSTTSSSSSQHLVIDHPMEDLKEEKVKPLKISLKRKLSYASDDGDLMGPQQKQVHLHDENEDQGNSAKSFHSNEEDKEDQPKLSGECSLVEDDKDMADNAELVNQVHEIEELGQRSNVLALENNEEKSWLFSKETGLEDSSFFKSLLLQQLEKPLVTSNIVTNRDVSLLTAVPTSFATSQLTVPPLLTEPESTAHITPTSPHPKPSDTGVTKYLCFKCKTGSFDTFVALTEHQATCLVSHNLFLFNQTTTQSSQQPPTSIAPPILINSLQNTNSFSAPKHTTFAELKEFISPQNQPAIPSTKKRYYKCSTCNTFHENWNLFLHIREKHNRHMCLYCVRFFPTAEKLALHLEIKHDLEQNHFNSEEALRNSIPVLESYPLESRFLMCCTCQHVFMETEQFSQHDCSEFIKPCTLCGQKGRHTNQCKAHPDRKRFSKLKKKKGKNIKTSEPLPLPLYTNERNQVDFTVPPITITNDNVNPTIISNSNLNCDSGCAVKPQQPPTFNSMHSEDSNSSNNMVIDESCNISHLPPAQTQPEENMNSNVILGAQTQTSCVQIEPDLPPDRQLVEPSLKLVVPKLKLRVPKEFQKSVDDALSSTSESGEDIDDDYTEDLKQTKKKYIETEKDSTPKTNTVSEICITKEFAIDATQNSLLAESTPANSQDMEIERNSASESATEAGNSQDDSVYKREQNNSKSQNPVFLLEDDDSLDEPNSNLVRIMQEIERTKLDIQRTKKTSIRHNKAAFALPRQPTISQSSNKTTDHNWSPTPPASPNSRWFTPRRATISQSGEEQLKKTPQHQQLVLMPPSSIKQLTTTHERRDTIGSDMMDIDETITSKPTQTIYCNKRLSLDNESFNNSNESIDGKSCRESMENNQKTDNETSAVSEINNSVLETEEWNKPASSLLLADFRQDHFKQKNSLEIVDIHPKQNSPETPEHTGISLTQSAENDLNKQTDTTHCQEDELEDETEIDVCGKVQEEHAQLTDNEKSLELEKLPPSDGIEVANDDTVIVDMKLDKPLDKYEVIDFVRICLKTVYPLCLYCNHARRIAVNGRSLVLHMIGHHRFSATVDSITAEELLPATIVTKLKSFLSQLEHHYFNSNSYCTYGEGTFTHHFNERIFECFQCRFVTSTHKELYLHNRKMHLRTAILCFMCRANFFSFSEILCHICPGVANKVSVFDVKFRCCLCELDNIPSPFRLMVHLRKKHFACDVCLEDCRDQSKLSSHVWKHKLHHLCYRCGIAYRNKLDITKHLFWKHGTESTICKRCLQKKWRHVYHFCIPPATFVCEVCNLCFSKAMHLRVHKRLHSGDLRYPCIEDNCEEKFISRKLLLKHALVHEVLSPETLQEKEKVPDILETKEREFSKTEDASEENFKAPSDLQNIKQEVMEIKMEPLEDSEMESKTLPKDNNNELVKQNETDEEKARIGGLKNSKDEETKEKKHLNSNQPGKKRKRSKRSKELLEDLNLTAPNLSESDSSDDSESDSDSKTKSEIDALPRVMLSPPSETENDDKDNKSSELVEPGQVLEIWKNFLKTQQDSSTVEELERLKATNDENKQSKHLPIHVACSDHDYCKIEEPKTETVLSGLPDQEEVEAPKDDFKKPAADITSTPETSPTKRKQNKSPRRTSSRRSNASSSSSGSSSSSDSSCSCGSNCSCSSSGSNSSSSSSSSEDSDSSLASNNSIRKRHRKKSERDRMRKRSESMSPLKQHKLSVSITESINVDDEDITKEGQNISERPPSPKEPLFYESDLETNESETDEEFYDEHPQKLANELLAQKRAQLMAQTRLSPSHNYDIVENSRPSTPSLPEELATNEKPKIKVKKKKRDRKNSCKGLHTNHIATSEQAIAPAQSVLEVHQSSNNVVQVASQQTFSPNTTLINSVIDSHHTKTTNLYTMSHNIMPQSIYALPPPAVLTEQSTLTPRPLTMPPYGHSHRMSEGSSCSDADGSLKRSKRQRRPNKFYGYTSDDENLINGPPLMIGTRAFKPQPPPQLTWRKEDLPTPSKSMLHIKNKTQRTLKPPATSENPYDSPFNVSSSKKKSRLSLIGGEKSVRKKPAKKKDAKTENKFPPIPTLKIRPSEIGLSTTINHTINKSDNYNTTDETSSDEETPKGPFSASTGFNSFAVKQIVAAIAPPILLPSQPPAPPTPNTTAFNHRIPPALLPNPDFATLQYFKANNIRYPIRPPAGARQPREGESVYCYCRCPYDEVSEMIACDGENCLIEWFHFECVGIMVAPQGKWFCAECRPKYSEELYPSSAAGQLGNV